MRRVLWRALLTLLLGIGLGLAYSWVLSPRRVSDAQPSTLRADFKDRYRSVVAAAYAATGDLARAQARLALLGDADSVEALNAQAQRMLVDTQGFEHADRVVALASALQEAKGGALLPAPTIELVSNSGVTLTPTSPPSLTDLPILETETPQSIETPTVAGETQTLVVEATARPTRTSTPEPGKPFGLTGQETVCDPNLPDGLLQVLVMNPSRRQLAGVEIVITWDGGEEQFFTGFKPELGNGYADYIMTPDTIYTIQLARGSDVALGVTAPTCQSPSGETFLGGIKLTFQQP